MTRIAVDAAVGDIDWAIIYINFTLNTAMLLGEIKLSKNMIPEQSNV